LLSYFPMVSLDKYRKHWYQFESTKTSRRFTLCLHRDAKGALHSVANSSADLPVHRNSATCII
jgi:hypothetical protein